MKTKHELRIFSLATVRKELKGGSSFKGILTPNLWVLFHCLFTVSLPFHHEHYLMRYPLWRCLTELYEQIRDYLNYLWNRHF